MSFPAFSDPLEGDFLTLAESVACRQFAGTMARVNELARNLKVAEVPVDTEAITPELLGARCWRPETGFVHVALKTEKAGREWSWIAGQTALAAFICGGAPSLDIEIVSKHPTTVAGHLFGSGHLILKGAGNSLLVKTVLPQTK